MEKNKLIYPCLRYTIPVISSICIISALLIMYVIKTDYTQIYFEMFFEKDTIYVYLTASTVWKKIMLFGLSLAMMAPHLFTLRKPLKSEAYNDWFRLSAVASMAILFFVIISPTELHLDPSVSTAIDEYGSVDSIISQNLQNRLALSSPLSILLIFSFCTLFHGLGRLHCIEILKNKPDIKDICALCIGLCAIYSAVFSIHLICKSIFYIPYIVENLEERNSIQPYLSAVVYIGDTLVLNCIHDALQMSRDEALAPQKSKTNMLVMGICIFAVGLPSLACFLLYLFGICPYYCHYALDAHERIEILLCIIVGLYMVVVSIKRRTFQYMKLLPFCLILWFNICLRTSTAQLSIDQIATVSTAAYKYNFVELPWIAFWSLLCVSMLFYTFYLILETPDRKTALILLAVCIFTAALTYLPPYVIELPIKSVDTEKSITSIPIVNLCIELMSPILLIAFGYRQKHIKTLQCE